MKIKEKKVITNAIEQGIQVAQQLSRDNNFTLDSTDGVKLLIDCVLESIDRICSFDDEEYIVEEGMIDNKGNSTFITGEDDDNFLPEAE